MPRLPLPVAWECRAPLQRPAFLGEWSGCRCLLRANAECRYSRAVSDNPFLDIGAPPEGEDPEAQVEYLKRVVTAFAATGNPRIKPLRKKLDTMLERLAAGAESARTEDELRTLAQEFAVEINALQRQTYELLVTVINQTRATWRVKLKQGGLPPGEKLDTEVLQKALAAYAQALRKMLAAAKRGDKAAHDAAARELEHAGELVDRAGGG